jgi:hypothetical protein
VREDECTKQRIIENLGRKDAVIASGQLERLAASIGRYAERAIVLSQLHAGDLDGLSCKRIGAPLLFGRLWQDTGCRAVIDELLAARGFEYPLARAVFVSVLHRIMVSGSDRACEKWMTDYDIPKIDQLALHHFYRAMAWLGEELDANQPADAAGFTFRAASQAGSHRLLPWPLLRSVIRGRRGASRARLQSPTV